MADDVVPHTFRALSESADRKFARVRDLPPYGRPSPNHYFHKVFKSYMRLWKYQQEHRQKLVQSGLKRWEIGDVASRIGQLYYGQYARTGEARFLLESYIFYEAIFHRGYFRQDGGEKDRGVRFKELRFYARFLLVAIVLNRWEMVKALIERFEAIVEDSLANFKETSFKEWKLVVQEIVRFMKADTAFANVRPLRYCAMFDSYPASLPYMSRFHSKKVLKFRDALLTSYHRNEVKFAELTLDTFRMLQCLEWEPSGSFYQKHPVESRENGSNIGHSATSGLIDINLAADMTDPNLPPNPKKAILYRPSVTHLMAVIATICEELPPESVILVYLSASGKARHPNISQIESSGVLKKSSKLKISHTSHGQNNSLYENHVDEKGNSGQCLEDSLCLGPSRDGGSNCLYPGDLIPFTRRPLFLIIDSDISYAFKVLHGSERGEPAALLLSPLKPSFKRADVTQSGSQFTLFLTAPLRAFCELVGLTYSDSDDGSYNDADNILSTSFSEWEVILCTSTTLDLVWAQVLLDPFMRRLILRFIFCRSVLAHFCPRENRDQYLPVCLPQLLDSLSANSEVVQSAVFRLANHLDVADCFHLYDR